MRIVIIGVEHPCSLSLLLGLSVVDRVSVFIGADGHFFILCLLLAEGGIPIIQSRVLALFLSELGPVQLSSHEQLLPRGVNDLDRGYEP